MDPLTILPEDIWFLTLRLLRYQDLRAAGAVCRLFVRLIRRRRQLHSYVVSPKTIRNVPTSTSRIIVGFDVSGRSIWFDHGTLRNLKGTISYFRAADVDDIRISRDCLRACGACKHSCNVILVDLRTGEELTRIRTTHPLAAFEDGDIFITSSQNIVGRFNRNGVLVSSSGPFPYNLGKLIVNQGRIDIRCLDNQPILVLD